MLGVMCLRCWNDNDDARVGEVYSTQNSSYRLLFSDTAREYTEQKIDSEIIDYGTFIPRTWKTISRHFDGANKKLLLPC